MTTRHTTRVNGEDVRIPTPISRAQAEYERALDAQAARIAEEEAARQRAEQGDREPRKLPNPDGEGFDALAAAREAERLAAEAHRASRDALVEACAAAPAGRRRALRRAARLHLEADALDAMAAVLRAALAEHDALPEHRRQYERLVPYVRDAKPGGR